MKKRRQKGFISCIILVLIGLALLKYFFDWSIFDALDSPRGAATISYIKDIISSVWAFIKEVIS